ncbi:hypothetical protein L1987_66392 [Smallanthus sonchifolius]|uniref:Uncharacterized protein n=1 Tax=Smallanthus sonchifolius TaxID=185202 RepID=A0ACB9BXC6_9ASTR|nr:hypothetical protein L1987_66392 [Smallanthus sonchifolius]
MDILSCDDVVLWNLYDIIGANPRNRCNLEIQCNLHGCGPTSVRSCEERTWARPENQPIPGEPVTYRVITTPDKFHPFCLVCASRQGFLICSFTVLLKSKIKLRTTEAA